LYFLVNQLNLVLLGWPLHILPFGNKIRFRIRSAVSLAWDLALLFACAAYPVHVYSVSCLLLDA
jgi:hypothetical protein